MLINGTRSDLQNSLMKKYGGQQTKTFYIVDKIVIE